MNETLRKFIGTILSIIASATIFFVLPEYSWKNLGIAILGGLCLGIYAHTYQIIDLLKEHSQNTVTSIENHITKIVEFLKVHNEYFNDKWLFNMLRQLVDMVRFANYSPHELEKVQKVFDEAVKTAKQNVGAPHFDDNIENGEIGRILLLNKAISNAKHYVYAVSFDKEGYFDDFWQKINNDYLQVNIKAAKDRGVIIERIFVMDDDVIKDNKNQKNKKLRHIISDLKKGGKNLKNYVVSKSEISQSVQNGGSSFFICDDVIACESANEDHKPYFAMNHNEIVQKLKNRFESYKIKSILW